MQSGVEAIAGTARASGKAALREPGCAVVSAASSGPLEITEQDPDLAEAMRILHLTWTT